VWIVRRTPEMLANLEKHDDELADPDSKRNTSGPDALNPPFACKNQWRSVNKEYLVLIGICTHLGCSPGQKFQTGPQPSLPSDWPGGWLCPCHGSTFDLAGRVFKNKPAPDNLGVPPYKLDNDEHPTRVLIGEVTKA
jgi:ubiquinol-cytochrome c reductase iron-sulfur subunit